MTKPTSSWAAAVLVFVAAIVVVGVSATAGVWFDHEICSPCGTFLVTRSVLGVFETEELEESAESRWMLGHATGAHEHAWVHSHTTWRGWKKNGIGCAMPEEARHVYALWSACDRVGEDPALVSLVTEFMSAAPSDTEHRREIVERASSLGSIASAK